MGENRTNIGLKAWLEVTPSIFWEYEKIEPI